ncbi:MULTISPECIES: MafI family immunity protein [unclassified Brenneria]|uniref:MafI family immunity protein n=1 Tax=unclassified Brenneria TaxID=2634434 RepID=UPI0029C560EA|nr:MULTISPECIES: MafI family immunity protein [unclassified Brenneria]MDX5631118.1 MafI family immunity protein [Brenneria sp. L3-3Z]MDX5698191.1 MafI family immunity protein [Brenneria sp. L4-2C]
MNVDYQEIEKNFSELIISLSKVFTSEEINEITEFIGYGEYGLALDTVIDIITEENKEISHDNLSIIVKLSNIMGLETGVIIDKIARHIC